MSPTNNRHLQINGTPIGVVSVDGEDYICLTHIAKSYGAERVVDNWIRNKNTISFLGLWERFHNTSFNYLEFDTIKNVAGLNSFTLSAKQWISRTNAKGILSKTGRYGGTYAHKDIAFEFGTWLSPEFKLLLITEFQRLKSEQAKSVEWDARRYISRVNYRLHTDSIKHHIIPSLHADAIATYVYTDEADMLNRIVFGQAAAEWKRSLGKTAPSTTNQRDSATTDQLILLANLESLNSHLISRGMPQQERTATLAREAVRQYRILIGDEPTPNSGEMLH